MAEITMMSLAEKAEANGITTNDLLVRTIKKVLCGKGVDEEMHFVMRLNPTFVLAVATAM